MSNIPLAYRLFFIYIEPISALAGAYYSFIYPSLYLRDLQWPPNSSPVNDVVPTTTKMTLYQLSNLYLLFAINEHLVLSSTPSLKVWKRLLFGLLVADIGHLFTMIPAAAVVGNTGLWAQLAPFWSFGMWNAMWWGSVGFVYAGASMRMAFLVGVGLDGAKRGERGKKGKTT